MDLSSACLKTTENLYLAAGQLKIITKINFLQLIFMAALIYLLTLKYRILGTGIAAAIPSALVLILSFHEAGKIIDTSFLSIIRTISPTASGSLIMFSLVMILQKLILNLSPALVLILLIALGAVSYSVFIWLTQKEEIEDIRRLTGGWKGL